ncbi:thiamine pyrophosphate-binding protein [Candidatus Pacearchaeota archaeon]|nr:thiamine pyrophosphate-binding protein [Candidatus Pacearchaeota archaeon]
MRQQIFLSCYQQKSLLKIKMKGSKKILQSLKEKGIKYIFGIMGREAQAILGNEVKGIKFILTRHEFTAGIMAEVYARLTQHPQVCWSTFGPGVTNLITAIASAYLDRSPLIAISAQVERNQIDPKNTHQCLEQTKMLQPITKDSYEVKKTNEIENTINSMFDLANNELKGPVFISIPIDVLAEEVKVIESKWKNRIKQNFNSKNINKLFKVIKQSNNPILLIGNEAVRAGVSNELRKFVEKYKIPVLTTSAGKGIIPENHSFSLGAINKYINDILNGDITKNIFKDVDLIITLGYDYVEDVKSNLWNVGKKKKIVRVSSLDNKTKKYFKPDLDVIGDLILILKEINQYEFNSNRKNNFEWFIEKKNYLLSHGKDFAPEKLMNVINAYLDENSILVSDIGIHKQYAVLFSKVYSPKSFLCSNGLGTFGFALPAAMAAKLAFPKRNILAITGDGGFHSVSHDLETAARYNLPITIIVVKDGSFGLIKHYQIVGHGYEFIPSVNFGDIDFVKLAEANGCIGYRIKSYDELDAILSEKPTKPRVIEVPIRYDYSFRS